MNNSSGTVRRLAASPHWQAADPPRIPPGGLRELGPRTWLMSKAGGWAMGGGDIRLLQVLGRHRPLLRAYLRFATGLVILGRLPRADIMTLGLPLLPPYAVVVHKGRRSGREYRTMVTAFRTGRTLVIPLGHGTRTDWVRNLLEADRGGVERMGRLHRITNPRVTDIATDGDVLPRFLRAQLRLMKILVADIEER